MNHQSLLIAAILIVVVLIFLSSSSFEIKTEIYIDAPRNEVWKVISDMSSYKKWNTQLEFLSGNAKKGEKVKLKLSVEGADPYEFEPTINLFVENQSFGWIARTGVPYIFDGEHTFTLQHQDKGTLLVNKEIYTGVLSLLIKRQPMMKAAPVGFKKMNKELKDYVEKNNIHE